MSLKIDLNGLFDFNAGNKRGVSERDLLKYNNKAKAAYSHLSELFADKNLRIELSLEWFKLPEQDSKLIKKIQKLGNEIAGKYDSVLFLGIGGSYLGLKAAQDALLSPYYNDFAGARKKRPGIYFEGNNLDPSTLSVLLKNLNPKKTFVVCISKSGETSETKAAFEITLNWLKKGAGKYYGRQVFAITDPNSGTLRKKVKEANCRDALAFRSLPLLEGVGGRFSELNMGLLHLAIVGISIKEVLSGAGAMAKRCMKPDLKQNPALMYALLHTILYREKGMALAVLMPFSEQLKSTADWYIQLLAESTGKKYERKVVFKNGAEKWKNGTKIINAGRTPISSRGTNDLHSIQQNNVEGENNKILTFIKVGRFKNDLVVPDTKDFLAGKRYGALLSVAQEGTEWALTRENRPSCTIAMSEINAYTWGELLFFFEMATAYEGELLNINAFNQPGVESYKNYMYYKLKKPGIKKEIAEEIEANPVIKKQKYML
ncbi:MAG: hypothetical protein NTX32_06465 [Candidatus Firestonebacteria bacterium]|nr:hypothetical protein [Candidatus Firestonebacteria bacterium]